MIPRHLGTHPDRLAHRRIQYQDKEKWPHEGRILDARAHKGATVINVEAETGPNFELTLPYPLDVLIGEPDGDTAIPMNDGEGRMVFIYSAARSN
jgi:hypothetical protein